MRLLIFGNVIMAWVFGCRNFTSWWSENRCSYSTTIHNVTGKVRNIHCTIWRTASCFSSNGKHIWRKPKTLTFERQKYSRQLFLLEFLFEFRNFLQLFASIFPMLIFLISVKWIPPTKFHWWGYVKIKNQIPILTFIYYFELKKWEYYVVS